MAELSAATTRDSGLARLSYIFAGNTGAQQSINSRLTIDFECNLEARKISYVLGVNSAKDAATTPYWRVGELHGNAFPRRRTAQ